MKLAKRALYRSALHSAGVNCGLIIKLGNRA